VSCARDGTLLVLAPVLCVSTITAMAMLPCLKYGMVPKVPMFGLGVQWRCLYASGACIHKRTKTVLIFVQYFTCANTIHMVNRPPGLKNHIILFPYGK
jgi:hypothetical protein